MRKIDVLILETCVIMGGLLLGGLILAAVLRPESVTPIILLLTGVGTAATTTILTLRGLKVNANKLDAVQQTATQAVKQTDGINTVLLANVKTLIDHATGAVPLTTGELEAIRDKVVDNQATISRTKGEGK